ncbi:MAG: GNAT family N-acetyltransferase, partial [Pseudomonadales bacterium]
MKTSDLPEVFSVRTATIENAISLEKLHEYGITEESLTRSMSSHVKGWVYEELGKIIGFVMGDKSNGEVQVLAVLP